MYKIVAPVGMNAAAITLMHISSTSTREQPILIGTPSIIPYVIPSTTSNMVAVCSNSKGHCSYPTRLL